MGMASEEEEPALWRAGQLLQSNDAIYRTLQNKQDEGVAKDDTAAVQVVTMSG
jgi:hypothetical protein